MYPTGYTTFFEKSVHVIAEDIIEQHQPSAEQRTADDVTAKALSLQNAVAEGDESAKSKALGELLFTACSLAGDLGINAEQALFVQNVDFCDNICTNCSKKSN